MTGRKSYKKDDEGLCLKIALKDQHLISFGERSFARLDIDFSVVEDEGTVALTMEDKNENI